MSTATINFSIRDQQLNVLTHYEGGFNPSNQAHQAALLLGAKMGELAEAQGPTVQMTAEEVAALFAAELQAVEPVGG